jgi:hypothetical protein
MRAGSQASRNDETSAWCIIEKLQALKEDKPPMDKTKMNYIYMDFRRIFLIAFLLLVPTGRALAQANEDFIVLYPGIYTEREKALVDKYVADNKAIEKRGQIDTQALVHGTLPKDTPGVGPVIHATEAMVRYNNAKYDPENPVLNVTEYAKKLGYQDILAYPTFAAHDDTFMAPYPPQARDRMLVSDLNHNITNYKPVYPGDTLYLVVNSRHFRDITPLEGSTYRSIAIQSEGSIYNQRGEKVSDVIFRVTEGERIYKEGKAKKNPTFADIWEAPDWLQRPAHYYTDKDWEFIKDLWSKEKRQGATPLYWEDVKIGDEPTWTVDGPVEASLSPTPPWGMGIGGSRTMKKEIMDPKIFKTMIRGQKDGIYRLPNKADYVPAVPEDKQTGKNENFTVSGAIDNRDIHKEGPTRAGLINYFGRDLAIRHLSNWMGDRGWLYNIRWSIMDPRAHAANGKIVPVNPQAEHYLDRVPKMKGKFVSTHPLIGDLAIVKSFVYDKYVRDSEFYVDLVWWIETITGEIYEEGGATIRLPSKSAK